ncbi:MAG: hypothetical protein ACHWZW_20290 [Spirulina sp.]
MTNPDTSPQDRDEASAALFILGFPPTALGSWLAWSLSQSHRQVAQKQIKQRERLFLDMLQQHQGRLTILQFAAAAELSMDDAKTFLDEKAKGLNASFDVSDTGAVVYCFPV